MYIHIYFCIHTRVFRNLSIKAQVIAWSMALALVFLLLVLSVFVFIILSGNTWISNGVNEGSQAVSTLLPETGPNKNTVTGGRRKSGTH